MIRDFKQRAAMPAERWLEALDLLEQRLRSSGVPRAASELPPLEKLAGFYGHLADLARGYVKDPAERETQVAVVSGWQAEVERLRHALSAP